MYSTIWPKLVIGQFLRRGKWTLLQTKWQLKPADPHPFFKKIIILFFNPIHDIYIDHQNLIFNIVKKSSAAYTFLLNFIFLLPLSDSSTFPGAIFFSSSDEMHCPIFNSSKLYYQIILIITVEIDYSVYNCQDVITKLQKADNNGHDISFPYQKLFNKVMSRNLVYPDFYDEFT